MNLLKFPPLDRKRLLQSPPPAEVPIKGEGEVEDEPAAGEPVDFEPTIRNGSRLVYQSKTLQVPTIIINESE